VLLIVKGRYQSRNHESIALILSSDQDAETAYNSLRISSTLDVAPNPEAWRNIQKLVSRVSPKVAQLDVNQIINGSFVKTLEETGYLPEARKNSACDRGEKAGRPVLQRPHRHLLQRPRYLPLNQRARTLCRCLDPAKKRGGNPTCCSPLSWLLM
jgi:hypothetical protein